MPVERECEHRHERARASGSHHGWHGEVQRAQAGEVLPRPVFPYR
jgi:hypothetical protein